jgi:hypothetical protein
VLCFCPTADQRDEHPRQKKEEGECKTSCLFHAGVRFLDGRTWRYERYPLYYLSVVCRLSMKGTRESDGITQLAAHLSEYYIFLVVIS